MAFKTLFLAAVALTALVLSGCVEEPPAGTFTTDREGASAQTAGSVVVEYTPFHSPADEAGMGAPGTVEETSGGAVPARCGADEAASNDPSGTASEYECTQPSSSFQFGFDTLPEPGAAGYTAFLVGAAGELELGPLEFNEHAEHMGEGGLMYSLNATVDEDLSGMYETIEVRHGGFTFAAASAASGTHEFTIVPAALAAQAAVSFDGMTLMVTLTDAPANATLVGWLVGMDPTEDILVHQESFEITGETTEFTASKTVTEYEEFHVHVEDSKINIAIASIPKAGAA